MFQSIIIPIYSLKKDQLMNTYPTLLQMSQIDGESLAFKLKSQLHNHIM